PSWRERLASAESAGYYSQAFRCSTFGRRSSTLFPATTLFRSTPNLGSPVSFTSGTIDGTGSLTISGLLSWSGGNMGDQGAPAAGSAALTGGLQSRENVVRNRTLVNGSGITVATAAVSSTTIAN